MLHPSANGDTKLKVAGGPSFVVHAVLTLDHHWRAADTGPEHDTSVPNESRLGPPEVLHRAVAAHRHTLQVAVWTPRGVGALYQGRARPGNVGPECCSVVPAAAIPPHVLELAAH